MSNNWAIQKTLKRFRRWRQRGLPQINPFSGPETGRVIFTSLASPDYRGPGKVDKKYFFRPFCDEIAKHGYRTFFVSSADELASTLTDDSVVVHIYNEEKEPFNVPVDRIDDLLRGHLTFNDFSQRNVIGFKRETNRVLSLNHVRVPAIVNDASGKIFSNSPASSGADIEVLENVMPDPARYNTEYIDTTVEYRGRTYHTCLRSICVSGHVIHTYVRARPAGEGASVHAIDTPADADLLEYLQEELVNKNAEKLNEIASKIATAIGPGFYAHDLLVKKGTSEIFVCETGLKFSDKSYSRLVLKLKNDLPSHRLMITDEFPRKSARAFLREISAFVPS